MYRLLGLGAPIVATLFVATVSLLNCTPAWANDSTLYGYDREIGEKGGWTIATNIARKSCMMFTFYEDDTLIEIGIDNTKKQPEFFMLFGSQKWSFKEDDSYSVEISFNGGRRIEGEGNGLLLNKIKGVAIEALYSNILDSFAAARTVRLWIEGKSYGGYNLSGSRAAMDRMFDCAKEVVKGNIPLAPDDDQASGEDRPKGEQSDGAETAAAEPADKEQTYSTGTGFFVNAEGDLLTNAHVVNGCKKAFIHLPDGRDVDASIVARETQNDLAILRADVKSADFAKFRGSPQVRLGDNVIVFGYPLTGTLSSTGNLSTGLVAALAGAGDDVTQLQISAPVQSGNSGGAVLDQSGHVVGVVVSKMNTTEKDEGKEKSVEVLQNVNFAIKSGIAQFFLDARQVGYTVEPPSADLSTPDVAAVAKNVTAQVVCPIEE